MKYIILIIFLVCGYNTQAKKSIISINSIPDTTQILKSINYDRLLQIAKDNINNATQDSHKLNTYKWFISLAPTEYIIKLNLWLNTYYPKFKYK